MNSLSNLIDASLTVEKLRVQSQVRLSHLKINERRDKETEGLHRKVVELEKYLDKRIAKLIVTHPAYPWFSRVKGVGKENIGKVIYCIRVKPDSENPDLPYADTISALWKFAGFAVENGHSPKRTKGEKLSYNSTLRSMTWRLVGNLLKAKGKFYEYYLNEKEKYVARFTSEGYKIVSQASMPKPDSKKAKEGKYISEGHIHNMALRKVSKLFLACIWLSWRSAEGLPLTKPYAIDKLKHDSFIDPEQMVDRD
jgi:hypothetical protein